jgi:predicted Zn-ribbon and HTH transcriptional regulator
MRERDAGGPQDRACYACACGFVFQAQVSASVDCPHCGGAQAW